MIRAERVSENFSCSARDSERAVEIAARKFRLREKQRCLAYIGALIRIASARLVDFQRLLRECFGIGRLAMYGDSKGIVPSLIRQFAARASDL